MRSLYIIFCVAVLTSCRSSFIKRKYLDGHFVSRTASVHSKSIDDNPTKVESINEVVDMVKVNKPSRDTIFLTTGQQIACNVEAITRRNVVYSYRSDPTTKFVVKSKKIYSIHMNSTAREYFRQPHEEGNPLLQFGLLNTGKEASGMAIFGYLLLIIVSLLGLAASQAVLVLTVLAVLLLIACATINPNTVGFRVLDSFGKFLGWTFVITLCICLLALIVLVAG